MPDSSVTRRDLLRTAAIGGAGLAFGGPVLTAAAEAAEAAAPPAQGASMMDVPFEQHKEVRVGIIGVGARGTSLLSDVLAVPGARVVALCDIVQSAVVRGQKMAMEKGQSEPTGYWRGERDFENLCKRDDLDLVLVATPWDWHVPMGLSAMRNGHHVGIEVPCATTIEGCWELVNMSEKTRRHAIILENCCYGANEMMAWNMVKQGLLGTVTHAEAAYIHDLRSLLVANESEGLWRRFPHIERNGNLYPTHGLGPVCNYFDVNRGDRMESLVSYSSLEASLTEYVRENIKAGDPKRRERYICGDMSTSLIRTTQGRTIMLQHDVVTPRPYSRLNMVQGTKGTFADYPARLALDSNDSHRWLPAEEYTKMKTQFEHKLWKEVGEIARRLGGHGGMDYIMLYRLVDCMKKGIAPDMDVYDLAAWSVPTPLSQNSVKAKGAPQVFPDFTRGKWRQKRNIWEG